MAKMPLDSSERITWAPQPGPQYSFIECPLPEIMFGGSRGGGKTDAILGKYLLKSWKYGGAFNAVFFRREMPQADDLIDRAKQLYLDIGAKWREQAREFVMPRGGRIRFRPLENITDAQKFQGQNLSDAAVEESGNYPDPAPIDMLYGALRSKGGVPVQLVLTANPGGPGQHWIKHRYIDPAPMGMKVLTRKLPNGSSHRYIYIPSRVQDNRILLENDPKYVDRLYLVGSTALVRAWLEGDWSVVAGAFFPEFSLEKHIIKPQELPMYWHRFRSFDWGSARPFAVHWWAVSDGELPRFPRGALICYREWYGAQKDATGETIPNTGLRLTAEEIADGIKEREADDVVGHRKTMGGVADPSIFTSDGGPSHADRMAARGVYFREADNARVARLGAMGGWDQVRARLKGDGEKSAIYFFSTCADLIRTLPALQHDTGRPEDVDTESEDHAGDSCFTKDTKISTNLGLKAIHELHVGEMVETRGGYCRVSAVFSVGERVVLRVLFSNGKSLTGTANHPVWVEGIGFIPLHSLRYGDIMRPCQLRSSTRRFRNLRGSDTTNVASISSDMGRDCTGLYGSILTDRSHGVRISTTKTWMSRIINQIILCASPRTNIFHIMGGCGLGSRQLSSLSMRGHRLLSGTLLQRGEGGIDFTGRKIAKLRYTDALSGTVSYVSQSMRRLLEPVAAFVQMRANRLIVAPSSSMSCSGHARNVGGHSFPPNSRTSAFAVLFAQILGSMSALKVKLFAFVVAARSWRGTSEQPGVLTVVGEPTTVGLRRVYNISVERAEEYFANGVLVHNCRYACMSRPYTAPLPPEMEPEKDRYSRRWKPRVIQGSGWAA